MKQREINKRLERAVKNYWSVRKSQQDRQQKAGRRDQGFRAAVTGGAQMDGFIEFFAELITDAGLPRQCVHLKKSLELPGFFRPTKEWDLLAIQDGRLLAAIEAKSQVGPSFGNNFNNRTEEAMGSALDLWTAYRENAFPSSPQPFLGYFFMLEDCPASQREVRVREPHFSVFPEFQSASYMKRYEIFCEKLMLERHYTATAFISSSRETGIQGAFSTPSKGLSIVQFARALAAHIGAHAES